MKEGTYNVTVQPWSSVVQNHYPVLVTIEIVGQVIGIKIDDNRIITNKDDNKWFTITFDSVGAGTCLALDYKDGYYVSYGDKEFCSSWGRTKNIPHVEGYVVEDPFLIDHVY